MLKKSKFAIPRHGSYIASYKAPDTETDSCIAIVCQLPAVISMDTNNFERDRKRDRKREGKREGKRER